MAAGALHIGRYLPLALLGQRRLLETFRARADEGELPSARAFVLKVLRKEGCAPSLVTRFLDTVRSLRWTSLPGLPGVVDIGEGPGPIFAAFEFSEGVNLSQLRAQAVPPEGVMDVRLAGLLARKVAERLGPLHAQGDGPGVHGGLSPGNVLVQPSGEVLLLDCALAESLRAEPGPPIENWHYAAPEQLQGAPAEKASDLYSLGALLYFLCFGKPPFAAVTPAELVDRIKEGPPDFTGLHPAVASCVGRMLAFDAAARPKSARDVMRQISVALLSAQAGRALATPPASSTMAESSSASVAASQEDEPVVPAYPELPRLSVDERMETGLRVLADGALEETQAHDARGAIAADDPDVGAVYDDDEDEIVVGPDGTVKRRRRRRAVYLLAWTKSEFARKVFRYAWVPVLVVLAVATLEGYFFLHSWRAARAESQRKEAALAAERDRLEALKPKLKKAPSIPSGHLVLKVSPPGAVVWIDGVEAGTAPNTMLTAPGAHRIVITAPGYRMLRDVVDTTKGVLWEREMSVAPRLDSGRVPLTVTCSTEGVYPVFVDGRDSGDLCPASDLRIEPGRHSIGLFVIPQNRIWTFDREVQLNRPHRIQFNY